MTFDPEIIAGIGLLVGTGAGSFAAVRKFPIWKNISSVSNTLEKSIKDHAEKCPEMACHDLVILTSSKVKDLEVDQALIFKKLDDMPDKIVERLLKTKGLF